MADLSLLEGAGILAAGLAMGRFWPARRRHPKPQKPSQPVCGCDHHLSYHDPDTGQCHGMMKIPSSGSRDSFHQSCTCRRYSGPEPLPEYYAPEIT